MSAVCTAIFTIVYFSVIFLSALALSGDKLSLKLQENRIGSLFEGLKLHGFGKYYNVFLLGKKFVFMMFLTLSYNGPLF